MDAHDLAQEVRLVATMKLLFEGGSIAWTHAMIVANVIDHVK